MKNRYLKLIHTLGFKDHQEQIDKDRNNGLDCSEEFIAWRAEDRALGRVRGVLLEPLDRLIEKAQNQRRELRRLNAKVKLLQAQLAVGSVRCSDRRGSVSSALRASHSTQGNHRFYPQYSILMGGVK